MKTQTALKFAFLKLAALVALNLLPGESALAHSTAHAPRAGAGDEPIKAYLQFEAERDVRGLESCYRGEIRKKDQEMQEGYGGRYSPGAPEANVVQIEGLYYRAPAKYCKRLLDSRMKPTSDEARAVYRICTTDESAVYLNSFGFTGSTTGTFELTGLVFKVEIKTSTTIVVKKDAGYYPEESDIVSEKTQNRITCRKVAF